MKLTRRQAEAFGIVDKVRARNQERAEQRRGAERLFDELCVAHGLPVPEHEYSFAQNPKTGKWYRFDWLFAGVVAVEKVGGVWKHGHHSRGKDQIDDMRRRNEAQILGYIVLEFPPEQFDDGSAFETIRRALNAEGEQP